MICRNTLTYMRKGWNSAGTKGVEALQKKSKSVHILAGSIRLIKRVRRMKLTHKQIILAIVLLISTATSINAAQMLFTPALTITERYSDNIYLVPDNEDDRVTKEEDYITAAGLNLIGQIVGRTARFELNYAPTYSSFANNSDLNFWRHAGRIYFRNDFSQHTLFEISDNYLETENPLDGTDAFFQDDPSQGSAIEPDSSRRGRNRYRTNLAQMRLSHQYGERDNFFLALQHDLREDIDTNPDVAVNDYTNLQPSMGWTHWLTRRWGIALNGYYSSRDYEDDIDREEIFGYFRFLRAFTRNLSSFIEYRQTYLNYDSESGDDYRFHMATLGIDYQFQESAAVTLAVGYYIQDYEDLDDEDDENGWGVNSDIFKRWGGQQSYITLSGASGYQIDDTGAEDLGLNFYYQGRIELGRAFTRRFSGSLFGSYRFDEYPNQTPERVDHTTNAVIMMKYQAIQWIFISLSYSYKDFQSDNRLAEYRENSVILAITMRPSSPFRMN